MIQCQAFHTRSLITLHIEKYFYAFSWVHSYSLSSHFLEHLRCCWFVCKRVDLPIFQIYQVELESIPAKGIGELCFIIEWNELQICTATIVIIAVVLYLERFRFTNLVSIYYIVTRLTILCNKELAGVELADLRNHFFTEIYFWGDPTLLASITISIYSAEDQARKGSKCNLMLLFTDCNIIDHSWSWP